MTRQLLAYIFLSVFSYVNAQIHFSDLPDTLQVDLDTKYAVDWDVAFSPVATCGNATMELLQPMFSAMDLLSDETKLMDNSLLYGQSHCTMEDLANVHDFMSNTPLPAPYSWFLGVENDDRIVFGIKDTSDVFIAKAAEASVSLNPLDNTPEVGFRLDCGETTGTAIAFKEFTERNVSRCIATEINQNFVMAPRLMMPIEEGALNACNLPTQLINKLFLYTAESEEIIEEVVEIEI